MAPRPCSSFRAGYIPQDGPEIICCPFASKQGSPRPKARGNLADTKSRGIAAASVTRVSGDDARYGSQAERLLEKLRKRHGIVPHTLCADICYGTAESITGLVARRIEPHFPLLAGNPLALRVWRRRTSNLQHLRKRRQKMERAKALKTALALTPTPACRISRKLRHRIEHLFGEAKQSHGRRRAQDRGLAKMNE